MRKQIRKSWPLILLAVGCAVFAASYFGAAQAAASTSDAAKMTVTAVGKKNTAPPAINQSDVQLTLGRERKQIVGWSKPEKLYLAVLIDDSIEARTASQWIDLKEFLTSQPESTSEMVAYARNGTAMIAQDFTSDHALAAKALRIPIGDFGGNGSAYLSLIDLVKRWPASSGERRSILLISSGIDYYRGSFGPESPDLETAISHAQRENINVWSIYSPDSRHRGRSLFRVTNAQSNLSRLSDETGAESYYIGAAPLVSFKPYLDEIETHLANQYLLTFAGGSDGGKKGKLERVRVNTELNGVEFMHADQVFLPPAQ
ncbi:MAG TPA: hypothetical protein VGI16_14205 [Candidatus Acidoferrum sp.]